MHYVDRVVQGACNVANPLEHSNPMLFMIRMSVDILPYTVGWWVLWAALALVITAGLLSKTFAPPATVLSRIRWFYEMAALAGAPSCMLVWGRCFWPPDGGYPTYQSPAMLVLDLIALAAVAVAVALVWRHRARLRLTLAAATLSLCWASGAFSVATMCIRDSWP